MLAHAGHKGLVCRKGTPGSPADMTDSRQSRGGLSEYREGNEKEETER